MTAALIFISTFVLVFALGFQSLNVNNGHYKMAFFTSIAIGVSNLILLKTVPQANLLEIVAYLTSGPFAIISSMWAHSKFVKSRIKKTDDVERYLLHHKWLSEKPYNYTANEIAKHFKVQPRVDK